MQEERRQGIEYLTTVTALLQRHRAAHPTAGLYEAADFHWWWRTPRPTDDIDQLFWFENGSPVAAVIATDWGDGVSLDPVLRHDAPEPEVELVIDRGLAHAAAHGFGTVTLEVDPDATAMCHELASRGFAIDGDGLVETWIDAAERPVVSKLPDGYRLSSRDEITDTPHHMIERSGTAVEARLRQTSLYRSDLDLVVHDDGGAVAGYGLFWFDPVTATGLVEPMRTNDDHQRRGIARHVLTVGLDLLARAGAERITICYEVDNAAARDLYLGIGFVPVRQTVVYTGPAGAA